MTNRAITLSMLAMALAFDVTLPRPDRDRTMAERLVGPVDRIRLPGPPAYRAGGQVVLFFEGRGMHGPIRGLVVVDAGTIRDVKILEAREGIDGTALAGTRMVRGFRDQPATPPVLADAITGATVSSQAVTDAVNERLKALVQWQR